MSVRIINADCLTALPQLAAEGVRAHCVVTDPPYHLTTGKKGGSGEASLNLNSPAGRSRVTTGGFMGQQWDGGDVAFRPETWAAVAECMLPGAHLLAFGGTRTFHRMACAIEDAGFEIRDTCMFLYGSGFPKSHNVERAVAMETCPLPGRHFGSSLPVPAKRLPGDHVCPTTLQSEPWDGYGTALKPSYEPIILARKPLSEGTVAANVLRHGCGAINVDACRVPMGSEVLDHTPQGDPARRSGVVGSDLGISRADVTTFRAAQAASIERTNTLGRWPANLLHDGSPEVEQAFASFGVRRSAGDYPSDSVGTGSGVTYMPEKRQGQLYADTGSASRFFYCAKANKSDRCDSKHPTVKPLKLMEWLVRLVCPEGGTILDPFAGTGSTGLAADQLGMNAILIERDAQYAADARRKITADAPLFAEVAD